MTRLYRVLATVALALLVGGCAHPINLTADAGAIASAPAATKIERKVGLVITDEQRKREVTTPGGGGDKVSYFPYRDLEAGLYFTLANAFTSVSRINGSADPKVAADGLTLIVVPEITTTSHSPSIVTWPPTIFTVELACTIRDAKDAVVLQFKVQGEGRAEFDEFKSDTSLSAKRASLDALKKLAKTLNDNAAKLR